MKHLDPQGFVFGAQPVPAPQGRGAYARWGKRLFDVALIVAALPLVLLLGGVIALLVALNGGAPIYAHERVGRGGQRFLCYKFRTMVRDADRALPALTAQDQGLAHEWARFHKLQEDPRVTSLGRFLRATSLDELPQLWNVLRGELSLIGPRPFSPAEEITYRQLGGGAYLRTLPGISGLWQVSARNDSAFAERIALDDRYCHQMSWAMDLRILCQTLLVMLRRTGV